jgi:hypothetical protein
VPLSDAARRLLAGLGSQPPGTTPAPEPEPDPDADRTGYRARAKAEEERFLRAVDPEYWLAFCFRGPGDPAAFAAALGVTMDDRRYVPGPVLEAATAAVRTDTSPAARVRQMLTARSTRDADITGQLAAKPAPDPLASLRDTQTGIEAASLAEFAVILAALTADPEPDPASIYDSPHWLLAYWADRAGKDAYLARTGLEVLGDKYLDGHQAARILGIKLKGG